MMNNKKETIFGELVDKNGRCVHYNSPLDIIANRCGTCNKLYSCYKCHDEIENHKFMPMDSNQADSVMCGVCGRFFSYQEYSKLCSCPDCESSFNPKCSLHKNIYAK